MEADRRKAQDTAAAEYATPALFLRGAEQPVLNRDAVQVQPRPKEAKPVSLGDVPMLSADELIGRCRELQELVNVVEGASKAGAQILGMGGVGKSSVAGRLMRRMADRSWKVASVTGR